MNKPGAKFVFLGNSRFSLIVLEELKARGWIPTLQITETQAELPFNTLKELRPDLFIVASFGKILSRKTLDIPRLGSLNVHPSLLPKLRGPSPIQNMILSNAKPGVTIIKMDERVDHGPIVAQREVAITPWPDHYSIVEEKLARVGGELLSENLPQWIESSLLPKTQNELEVSYTELIRKEDGLLNLDGNPTGNLRKVLAYSTWPGAYLIHTRSDTQKIHVIVKDAKIEKGIFLPTRVIPAGKKEMAWTDFLRGNR